MTEKPTKDSLERCVTEYQKAIIMMELPSDDYANAATTAVKCLIEQGYEGIYVTFQRPYQNMAALFEQKNVDIDKIWFIDAATEMSDKNLVFEEKCIHISPEIDVDDLVRAIYLTLPKLKSSKKFVFIDSLTTIGLYKPLSEVLRLSEFLIRTVKRHDAENVVLLFNVAKDLAQKRFIKDIALHVDEVVSV